LECANRHWRRLGEPELQRVQHECRDKHRSEPGPPCKADVTIYANYGGFNSDPFKVTIVAPEKLTLSTDVSPNPADVADGAGYKSTYQWVLTDTCGAQDAGLDGNETFGVWTDGYFTSTGGTHNRWPLPPLTATYRSNAIWYDTIGATGTSTPSSKTPQSPLTSVKVMHDTPWTLFVGTQTFGSGVVVHIDTQQWYQDHGRHY
jgi:hypothetical protein